MSSKKKHIFLPFFQNTNIYEYSKVYPNILFYFVLFCKTLKMRNFISVKVCSFSIHDICEGNIKHSNQQKKTEQFKESVAGRFKENATSWQWFTDRKILSWSTGVLLPYIKGMQTHSKEYTETKEFSKDRFFL